MKLNLFKICLISVLISLFAIASSGQNSGRRNNEPLPKKLRERLHKLKIEEEKKEFQKLLDRSEEVAALSKEIHTSFEENKKFTSKDSAKLKRVEKLLKKIRRELKAGKAVDDDDKEKLNSISEALKSLQENTSKLFNEVKKTTRHSVSAVAIQSSNTVLKVLKFLRLKK